MISTNQAQQFLDKQEKIQLKKTDFKCFSTPYKKLGLMISGLDIKPSDLYYLNIKNQPKKFISQFGDDFEFNPWTSKEGHKLAEVLFGTITAPYIATIWESMNDLPYQTGYERRAFRNSPGIKHLQHKLDILGNIYSSGNGNGFSHLTIREQIQYSAYCHIITHAYVFAAAIDNTEANEKDQLDVLVYDIIQGEDDIGGVSRPLIKALLLSKHPRNWKLVGGLLLAAQRQEGLRQSILECLDETQLGAMQYMIKLILEHELMRFSSVVRAVDTWFGFGWEAPKKATIKRILKHTLELMNDKLLIDKSMVSKDFLEVYVALWVLALKNTDFANEKALEMVFNDDEKDRKLLGLFFVHATRRSNSSLVDYMRRSMCNDAELDYWLLKAAPDFKVDDELFTAIKQSADSLPTKGKSYQSRVFSWMNYTIRPDDFYEKLIQKASDAHLESLADNISLLPSDSRAAYIRKVFPDHFSYSHYSFGQEIPPIIKTKNLGWKRAVIHQAIVDRNEAVMATGIKLFSSMELASPELSILESLLTRKGKFLRKEVISLLSEQKEHTLKQTITNLLKSKQIDQRLAGLELLTIIDEKSLYTDFIKSHSTNYLSRAKFNKNEQVFLDKLNKQESEFTFANGFGVIDYENLSPLVIPQPRFKHEKSWVNKLTGKKSGIISQFVDERKTVAAVNDLIKLFQANNDHEYQYLDYYGEKRTALLSGTLAYTVDVEQASNQEKLMALPLVDLWIDWYKSSGLNDMELATALHYALNFLNPFGHQQLEKYVKNYIADLTTLNFKQSFYDPLNSHIAKLLQHLLDSYADSDVLNETMLDFLEDAIAKFPEKMKSMYFDESHWQQHEMLWFDALVTNPFFVRLTDKESKRMWDFRRYLMAQNLAYPETADNLGAVITCEPRSKLFEGTSAEQTMHLYHQGLATKDDLLLDSLLSEVMHFKLDAINANSAVKTKIIEQYNPPFEIFAQLKKNLLSLELKRGDVETEASKYIRRFYAFKGMDYLFEILERMGKSVFSNGYYYNSTEKTVTFSYIISHSYPKETDTYEKFAERLDELKLTTLRLLEVACYATQWADWIGRYLKIDKLTSAVWWFHAHSSEYMNANKETHISRYSNIPLADFELGSLDIEWFYDVYENLGKAKWKLLHTASKYISSGHAARQVKLYSSVLLGEVKITATLKKIKDKRDKVFVCALGLIPLSKVNPEADLLKRYNLLQTFLKESKQFGAQRQQSEKIAVEVGLENLTRNAGYTDSTRFSWAMESKAAQKIMANSTVTIDEVIIRLKVDDMGKSYLAVSKNGKSQKTIPAKYKKHQDVIKLKADKAYLSQQYARTRQSLEKAMLNNDRFSHQEVENIMQHPVVKPMLKKLVLFHPETQVTGFWQAGDLIDFEQRKHTLSHKDELVIAHVTHLFESAVWSQYQRYLFAQKIQQPFKQVFRELYVLTDDERENYNRSHRYQGHQIQPQKTVALLRSRGWTLNHEEGLQKVFHKQGYMASIYAMADWYSPSDIEAPTIEYVAFTSLQDGKSIPLTEISPLIFSEVMRDVDLVVSVAHVGGVDPEASHSSMQMRAVLAKESARLFKLDNIEVKQRHVLITGSLGNYSIHLGSGQVSKNGLSLSIIPVHSQHRGRLFLPFVDDDPKSAEIIAKMKLLAEDHKIQDPTVLAQINKN